MSAASVDNISWCSSPNGEFDLKEAYNLACAVQDAHFAYIKVFPLEKFFGARGLAVPISCPLCNVDVESIILILRDCPLAKEFWDSFPIPIQTSTFYGSGGPLGNDVIIADCIEGLQKIPRTRIQHCYREANKCADALARRGALLPQDLVIFHSPLVDVALLINLDATGIVYERRRFFIVFFYSCDELTICDLDND
uniref:RNase H type-1 domain-containing protein n=1 Tax=Quercus lobata TaxID=97700 RepID=A0A7N2R816_QUELO